MSARTFAEQEEGSQQPKPIMKLNHKLRVGILGATGVVGQRFIQLLEGHPQIEITVVAASDRSRGQFFSDGCTWRLPGEIPAAVRSLEIQPPRAPLDCDFVLSSLPSDVAQEVENSFAKAGYPVISNSSSFRMYDDVPLLIPEVNPEHLGLLLAQKARYGNSGGFIVTNPNCSTIVLTLALAPLHRLFGIESVVATTMQAISGAGHPGVASLDITDNLLPFIEGEEEKIERETSKILGDWSGTPVKKAGFAVSAQCHRVNVVDGHTVSVRVKLSQKASTEDLVQAFRSFSGLPQELGLRSAPKHPLIVRQERDRPQPKLDREAGSGMSVTVGRIAPDPIFDFRFVALGHNTIRGAAGAAILNAELMIDRGLIRSRRE